MLGLDTHRKVFLYSKPCDMRKGFDGLYELVFGSHGVESSPGGYFGQTMPPISE